MALHHLGPELVIETCPKSRTDHVKRLTMDSREKDNKGNQRLTIHIHPKLAHLIALLGHLNLHASDLFLVLTDIRGEPGGHALGCNLQVPLPLKLTLEVVDPLLSVGTLLASHLSACAELLYGPKLIILLLP